VRNDGALKACAHFTRNHLSTQTLAQGNQGLALEERERWSECLRKCLSRGWSAMSEQGEKGLNTTAQKLVVTVQSQASSVLPTRCWYYRGVSQKPNGSAVSVERHRVGSTDPLAKTRQ
jgi:hypothetical protein